MEKEITAAIIQAVPVCAAALLGGLGFNAWRRQLREERHINHAENALAAAASMFTAVRLMRSPFQRVPIPGPSDRKAEREAINSDRESRIARAWEAWQRFQNQYQLARLYSDPEKESLDVADETNEVIFELQLLYEQIAFITANQDGLGGSREHDELRKARAEFYGHTPDELGARLQRADAALQAELRPILLPHPVLHKRMIRIFTRR